MNSNPVLARAIAAVLSTGAAGTVYAQSSEQPAGTTEIQEITVTAQRRVENAQDVPITLQALTGDTLKQLNVTTFDDYVRYLPNVTSQGNGPGQNNIYMRGLATAVGGIQAAGVVGIFPNVAIYLDEVSGQLPGRNLDIYAADLERVEVLEGPQGTLFGAGAQAGVVRYIANKPKLNATEVNFSAGYATTAHGDESNNLEGAINLSVIPDKLAIRAVVYNDSRGGYIDNIPGTFVRKPTDRGANYTYGALPQNQASANNNNIAARDINDATYKGIRAQALFQFNDDWNVLVGQTYQNLKTDGVFAEQQISSDGVRQPDLTVQEYNPDSVKDRFHLTSWTLNGRVGALKAVYAGGYLARDVEQIQDYTNYTRGKYANYYQCIPANLRPDGVARCFSPSATWHDQERNTHISHEFRLSTPDELRVRAIGGAFYENYKIKEQVDWLYKTASENFGNIAPQTGYYTLNGSVFQPNGKAVEYKTPGAVFVPGAPTVANPNVRNDNTGFFDDIDRGYKQQALFTSIDFDLIPKVLTITGGTRYYRIKSTEVGSVVGSFGCRGAPDALLQPCVNHSNGANLDSLGLKKRYSGFKSRGNLTWKVTPDAMVYYTWSQGFRAGGFNRPNAVETGSPLTGIFNPPVSFDPDSLTNNEIGFKTEWFERRLQFNGGVYQERWKNTQLSLFDPGVTGNLTFNANGGTYRVRGIETTFIGRATEHLTITGGASWNSSKLTKEAQLSDVNGNPIIFENLTDANGNNLGLSNPAGVKGDPLASSPPFQGNIRARYDFNIMDYNAFVQAGAVHQAHSYSTTDKLTTDLQGNSIAYDNPEFTMYDASVGIARDAWAVQAYVQNLTDKRAELFSNARQWYKSVTVSRPRTIGVTLNYRFSDLK